MTSSAGREWADTATWLRLELDEAEADRDRYRAALEEARNTLGPDHFGGEIEGLIVEGNEALRVINAALEGEE